MLQKGARKTIEPGWILLENKATSDVFRNPRLVQNIRHARGRYITTCCNSGNCCTTKKSTLKGYGMVWFDEGAIINILSFSTNMENYPVLYDTKGNYFYIMRLYKKSCSYKSHQGYTSMTPPTEIWSSSKPFLGSVRDSPSNNTTAPSKRDMY